MVQTNKILTVSYGTFSCTLEGFDESFETMKAIAEYFRDLAGDDRYFGAEPPTPDAEMLARIAEKEISRRVEARFENDGIVLRPSLPAATEAETADEADDAPQIAPEVDAQAPADVEAETAPEVADSPDTALDLSDADVAEDDDFDAELEAVAEDDDFDAELEAVAAALTEGFDEAVQQPALEEVQDAEDDEGEAPVANAVTVQAEPAVEFDIEAAKPERVPESIAEKLARIRAVVSSASAERRQAEVAVEQPVVEDAVAVSAEDAPAAEEIRIEDVLIDETPSVAADEEITAEVEAEDLSEALDVADTDETAPADDAALLGNIMSTLASGEGEDVLIATDEAAEIDSAEAIAETAEETLTDEAAAISEAITAEVDVADEDTAEPAVAADLTEDAAEVETDADAASVAPRRVAPRRPVRVVKVKRRAVEEAQLETSLSDDDEADLMRNLAEVEAEVAGEETPAPVLTEKTTTDADAPEINEDFAETKHAVRVMARRDRRDSFAEDEGDVSRLMAATDEQLQEPEGRSRRNAIAHLRAAVAATRADRGQSDSADATSDPRGAYRDDLAAAVRPRRNAEADQERPKVAPLKLVAEQRVDLPENEVPAPGTVARSVRPRRVQMPLEREEEEAGGFAAFAEEVGANRLPELLEAAASYMAFVEGRDQFSRPQLMTKVRQVEPADSSREDRLRSFGQLLRDGKIEKVDGGRFAASDSIGFRPDKRAAG
ncbi:MULTISPECIES: chemotaxis protein CheA [unclassified Marinovum]